MPIKPMLAVRADLRDLAYPMIAQPKFDGVRCIVDPELGPVTREGLPLPNRHVAEALNRRELWGVDGELIAPGGFEAAQSAFTGRAPPPDGWRFMAFDIADGAETFERRFARMRGRVEALGAQSIVEPAHTWRAMNADMAHAIYDCALNSGHEGLILRSLDWPYREGKASPARGELIKVKSTTEFEAVITDVRGRDAAAAQLGAVQFTGAGGRQTWAYVTLPSEAAARLWTQRASLPGRLATFRHDGFTAAGAPRHTRMVGLRRDLTP